MWNNHFVFLILVSANAEPQAPQLVWYSRPPRVRLDVYYEALCRDCIRLFREQLTPLMGQFGPYIDLHSYPYGKTKMHTNGTRVAFQGHHGFPDVYGNKLHACANSILGSAANAFEFVACIMERRSTEPAANECGNILNINPEYIKSCAKSMHGVRLLYYVGIESSQAKIVNVPHVILNGREVAIFIQEKHYLNQSLTTAVRQALGV